MARRSTPPRVASAGWPGVLGRVALAFDPAELLPILCCPKSRALLKLVGEEWGDEEIRIVVDEAELKQRFGRVMARIVDAETGLFVPDASVRLGFAWGGGATRRTDAEGRVLFERVIPESLDFEVSKPDYAEVYREILLAPGESRDLGDVPMTRPGRMRGRVFAADGEPLSGISFAFFPTGRSRARSLPAR